MTRAPTVSLTIDWFAVVAELRRHGYSTRTLSVLVGVPRSNINHWVNYGRMPGYEDGERLVRFWIDTTGKAREALPMRARELSAAKVR